MRKMQLRPDLPLKSGRIWKKRIRCDLSARHSNTNLWRHVKQYQKALEYNPLPRWQKIRALGKKSFIHISLLIYSILKMHLYRVSKKFAKIFCCHNSNKRCDLTSPKLANIYSSIKLTDNDPPHLIIFQHDLGNLTVPNNGHWPAQQLIENTHISWFYWTKELIRLSEFLLLVPVEKMVTFFGWKSNCRSGG